VLFGGKALKAPMDDVAGVENEIRGNLLKAGGAAFVPEEAAAFLRWSRYARLFWPLGGFQPIPFWRTTQAGLYRL